MDFVGLTFVWKWSRANQRKSRCNYRFSSSHHKKELERFLGMAGYYRQFVLMMSDIAEPLNRLRKKGQPFVWDDDCNKAFGTLKEKLANPPVLAFPDWRKPFYIETDNSDFSFGGTLSQLNAKTETLQPYRVLLQCVATIRKKLFTRRKGMLGNINCIKKVETLLQSSSRTHFLSQIMNR